MDLTFFTQKMGPAEEAYVLSDMLKFGQDIMNVGKSR